jgi:tetratricopeptide (TPR) repeat protein
MLKNAINKIFGKYRVSTKDGIQEFVAVEMDVDKYHNKGIKYLNAKKYKNAIEMFTKEIACEPDCDIGYHSLGQTFQAMGNIEEAKKNYMHMHLTPVTKRCRIYIYGGLP